MKNLFQVEFMFAIPEYVPFNGPPIQIAIENLSLIMKEYANNATLHWIGGPLNGTYSGITSIVNFVFFCNWQIPVHMIHIQTLLYAIFHCICASCCPYTSYQVYSLHSGTVPVYSDLYVICILFIYNLCVILKYP